ncbi:DUF5753 domain-containing protein [Nocardia thraciensis]
MNKLDDPTGLNLQRFAELMDSSTLGSRGARALQQRVSDDTVDEVIEAANRRYASGAAEVPDNEFDECVSEQSSEGTAQHDCDSELAAADRDPTAARILLGARLRRLRESSEISLEGTAEHIRASTAKVSRLERGLIRFKEHDIRDLLTLYGVADPRQRRMYLDMARWANNPGWRHRYRDLLPSWFETYLGLEQAAAAIKTYEPQFIPGLLQSPGYARAILSDGNEEEIDRRVEVRIRRQQVLSQTWGPRLWAVVDESALRRPVGGSQILRDQLDHLIHLAVARSNITVQVLPFAAAGRYVSPGCPFSILRFREPELPDIVYTEQLTSSVYLDKERDIDAYTTTWNRIALQALSPEASVEFLDVVRAELEPRRESA